MTSRSSRCKSGNLPRVPRWARDRLLNQLDALVNEGLDHIAAGDIDAARALWEQASRRAAQLEGTRRPEPLPIVDTWLLGGMLASRDGDFDAALAAFARASRAAPDHAQYPLASGDVHLFHLNDPRSAIDLYDRALAVADNAEERADICHALGLAHERLGDRAKMIEAWLRTRQFDAEVPPPPWHMDEAEFEHIAERALTELPDDARAHLANVPIFAEDAPSEPLIRSGVDPRLLGLFSGTPLPYRSSIVDGQIPQIDAIYLFQRNLERATTGRDHLIEEIRITVLHETAHYFGLEDDDLDDIGLG